MRMSDSRIRNTRIMNIIGASGMATPNGRLLIDANLHSVLGLKNGRVNMSTVSKSLGMILLVAAVSGCATTYYRYISNTNATQQQFMRDRYSCYQETQQRVSNAYANQYGGVANSRVMPTCSAFNACLAARGYYRSDTTNLADFNQPGSLSVPQGSVIQCSQ